MKKWSLISFTILAQAAAGAFVILTGHTALMGAAAVVLPDLPVLVICCVLMAAALIVSLAHLGVPTKAPWAAANVEGSWLSREIVFALLFTGSAALTTLFVWKEMLPIIRIVISWIGVLFAFGLVFSMSRVYMVRTVRVWNTPLTLLGFFLTALLLGALVNAAPARRVNEMMVSGMLFLIAAGLLVFVLWAFRVGDVVRENNLTWAVGLRVGLYLLGAGLLVAILYTARTGLSLVQLALDVLLAGEVLGRWLFYRLQELTEWEN
jgi:anaerobic dimethyl sulfoxide reductase subunit C (anchor subunit)